jgi:hypothetical protein
MKQKLKFILLCGLLVSLVGCGNNQTVNGCVIGETKCYPEDPAKKLVCASDGQTWDEMPCPERTSCDAEEGDCVLFACEPDSLRCAQQVVQWCDLSGTRWIDRVACSNGQTCQEGTCLDNSCTPGDKICGMDVLFICNSAGTNWERQTCPAGTDCLFGQCLACLNNEGCLDNQFCVQGSCVEPQLQIITHLLPDASLNSVYQTELRAEQGVEPLSWTLVEGQLPDGLELTETGWS